MSSIYLRAFDEDSTKVGYAAIRLNDWPDAPDRCVDTPEARAGQFGFGAIIDWAAINYRWSDSSAKREIVKLQRQQDVAEYLDEGFVFTDWIATVTDVRLKESSEPGGKLRANKSAAVVKVGFEKISLQNSWQGAGAESAIMEGAPLFDLAVKLGKGQKVLVSGRFIKGKDGGPRETSLTEEGGMREPEFDVVFTDIKVKK